MYDFTYVQLNIKFYAQLRCVRRRFDDDDERHHLEFDLYMSRKPSHGRADVMMIRPVGV